MKCSKCGKEGILKHGLCSDCYREVIQNKYRKRKKHSTNMNYILKNLDKDEKILNKTELSPLVNFYIIALFAVAIILFPKTIIEFFVNKEKIFFLLLIFNILIFFFAVYLIFYFLSRDIFLTNKKIIGKWGLFKVKKLNIPLNNLISIDTHFITGLEIDTKEKNYYFDFIGNNKSFKMTTIMQIKKLIDSADNEKDLMSFSHSLQDVEFTSDDPNMIICKCCKQKIAKDSITCVHCGNPIIENQRSADLFLKILCFILPPVGIIEFLLNIAPYPKFAKECLIWAMFLPFIILVIYLSLLSIF